MQLPIVLITALLTVPFSVSASEAGISPAEPALRLESVGYGEHPPAPQPGTAHRAGPRLEIRRGGLTEWYVQDGKGIEPSSALAVLLNPSQDLTAPLRLVLRDASGEPTFLDLHQPE